MAPSILKDYLGFGGGAASTPEKEKAPIRALPSSWYTSQEMFELERRAIFSKRWLLTTHQVRLPETGNWLRYEIAGYPFVLVRNRQGEINGFHNVCRHRAFPVVTEEQGKNSIFSCKYHGWSYGLNGNLAKAPGYQDLPGFDKTKNNLFPVHVHVDRNGFIWVNLDGGEKPEVPWEEDFKDIDLLPRFQEHNFDDYVFDHSWEMEGAYNWKILADNYNECYHCGTAHPDIPSLADLSAYSVDNQDGTIIHNAAATPEQVQRGLKIASTYFYPNASMTVSPHFFFMQRFVPTSQNHCVMRYEVYRNKNSSDENFELINSMYKRIMSEDKYLCENAQKNLERGVFVNGELHPEMEKGPLYFQRVVREMVQEHFKREENEGREIWPAQQTLPSNASTSKDDMDFCDKLSSQSKANNNSDCRSSLAAQASECCGGMACQTPSMNLAY